MSEMFIFDSKKRINHKNFEKEKDLNIFIKKHAKEIFGITILFTEYGIYDRKSKRQFSIDAVGIDEDNRPVIIEYKIKTSKDILSQTLSYLVLFEENQEKFQTKIKSLQRNQEIDFRPQGICIAPSFGRYDINAAASKGIELYEYKSFGEPSPNIVMFELINNNSKKEPEPTDIPKPHVKPSNNKKSYLDIYQNFNQEMKEIVNTIDHFILTNFEQANVSIIKNSRNYKRNHTFCNVSIWDENIYLWLKLKWNDDYQDKYQATDYTEKNANNKDETRCNVKISLSSLADFEQVKPLLKTAYEEN